MTVNAVYATWFAYLVQLRPGERITRVRNLAALLSGIAQSRKVFISAIAEYLPGAACALSLTRRLDRFLENAAFEPLVWYAPLARHLLAVRGSQHGLVLILDSTRVSFHQQLVVVALAYHHRSLPLSWTWVPRRRGHSSAAQQLAVLTEVWRMVPPTTRVVLVGDVEFGSTRIVHALQAWGWQYVLRKKGNIGVRPHGQACWAPFGRLVSAPGQSVWQTDWQCIERSAVTTNLLAHWAPGAETPWLLITNLPVPGRTLTAYRRRMWIEEMFGDLKGNGFDLESTHLQAPDKLSRLTFAVFVLYLSLVALGTRVLRRGQRPLVDRRERRDLSVFRLGWRMFQRLRANAQPIPIALNPFVT